tara:strand:- start:169 stop:750 length:582 start_codon:yes stop_codon:yes gene_type:complete
MINKFIAKKRSNLSGVKPNQKEQMDTQITPKNRETRTVLESNPEFHIARLENMMAPSTSSLQPMTSNVEIRSVLIGPGIEFDGSLCNCDEVVIEGTVRATIATTHLIVKATGRFTGSAEVEKAEIDGQYEGTLTAKTQLQINQTGTVIGDINYAQLEVTPGGILTGNVDALTKGEDKQIVRPPPDPQEEKTQP